MMARQASLMQAAVTTFEDLTFLLPEDNDRADGRDADLCVAVVNFAGSLRGRLTVAAPEPLIAIVAGTMLGGAATPALADDAFGELCNVICGNVLPLVGSAADVCELERPFVLRGVELPVGEPVSLSVEGHAVRVWLELAGSGAAAPT